MNLNRTGMSPNFKSQVLISGYEDFSYKQKAIVNSKRFLNAMDILSKNKDENIVNIVSEPYSPEDLKMNIIKRTGKNQSVVAHNYIYSDYSTDEILNSYNMMAKDDAIWDPTYRYDTKGLFNEYNGKLANYIA